MFEFADMETADIGIKGSNPLGAHTLAVIGGAISVPFAVKRP